MRDRKEIERINKQIQNTVHGVTLILEVLLDIRDQLEYIKNTK